MKVIINTCFGGFGLSIEGVRLYLKKKGLPLFIYNNSLEHFKKYVRGEDNTFSMYFTKDKGDSFIWEKDFNSDGYFYDGDLKRDDKILIEVVEELKEKASGRFSKLQIVEIPDNIEYEIDEYDGQESIHEVHRSWS